MQTLTPFIPLGIVCFFLASALTKQSIVWANRMNAVAHANERSSHKLPTPRIGGVGIVGSVAMAMIVYFFATTPIQKLASFSVIDSVGISFIGLLVMTILAHVLGLWDDLKDMPAIMKLVGQVVVAAIAPATGLYFRQIQIPFIEPIFLPPLVGVAISFVWVLGVMNAVNFMDGINGLAGYFGAAFGIALTCSFAFSGWTYELQWLGVALAAACFGFLKWNNPEAKTFMGDCGSQALGAFVAGVSLLVVSNDLKLSALEDGIPQYQLYSPFIPMVILVSVFIFDIGYTMIRRSLQGENLLKAHRSNLYQRYLIAIGEDHAQTLQRLQMHIGISGIIAVIYFRFTTYTSGGFRAFLITVALVNLVAYYRAVMSAEAAAKSPTVPEN